jgi:hypothetical protein
MALIAPAVTRAGAFACASDKISGTDARKLAGAARKTAGALRLVKSSLTACIDPGHGRASYDAQPVSRMDGSVVRPQVICRRDTGPWSCELLRKRTVRIDITRGGSKQLHEFELPPWLEVGDARRLVQLAYELAPTLAGPQQCGWQPDEKASADAGKSAFNDGSLDAPGAREIIEQPDGVGVVVNSTLMKFVLSPDHNAWRFICWSGWIVVS